MSTDSAAAGWQPTPALVRAALGSATAAALAVALGRPDLLVLAAPLLLATVAAARRRPRAVPGLRSRVVHASVREGEGTAVRLDLDRAGDVDLLVVAVRQRGLVALRPPAGVVGAAGRGETLRVDVPLAPLRWGRRFLGDGLAAATSPWAGYRWGPVEVAAQPVTVLPLPGRFDAAAAAPHPLGLVGGNPARRTGDGTEFAGIRPFRPGDRLRRLHWRTTLRTGALQVTTTHSEEDTSVLLIVDAVADLGTSGGVRGAASSLDVAVRAAGAVGEHYLHRGERVGLRVLGSHRHSSLPVRPGRAHLRRLLDSLALMAPGTERDVDPARLQFGLTEGTVAVLFSPLLTSGTVAAAVALRRRGVSVVVVDSVPDDLDLGSSGPRRATAWRIRALERDAVSRAVQAAGIPVVRWRGPGTLDEVLRRLARQPAATRGHR
ncbi:MAG TPA: DUF58 domain-containing protein [Nocardioidaceae bacterium]|nr:DUF58 domain-containing protein [Nocardioidaceae bacterium]